jgi:hypothetical protein
VKSYPVTWAIKLMKKLILLLGLLVLACGCGGEQPRMAGSKWAEALQHPDRKTCRKAAFTLGNIGQSDPAALPALLGALQDPDAGVRCEAVLALLKCGQEAGETVPALTKLEKYDADSRVRGHAAQALESLAREKP